MKDWASGHRLAAMPIVRVTGPASAAVTHLFLHGTPGDANDLDLVAAHAAAGSRIAWYELPDHGTQPDLQDTSLRLLEDDILAAASSIAGPIVVVGYSITAYLTARLLPRLGSTVERAVFIGGFPYLEPAQIQMRTDLGRAIEMGALTVETLVAPVTGLFLGSRASNVSAAARVERAVLETSKARLLRIVARIEQLGDPEVAVSGYEPPAIALHAAGDQAVPVHLGRALAKLGARCAFHEVDTDSHALPWTHPELCAKAVFARGA